MEFILLKTKEGKIVIYGGYGLSLDANSKELIVNNIALTIELTPPITKSDIENLYEELRDKLNQEDLTKLFQILKNHIESGFSD